MPLYPKLLVKVNSQLNKRLRDLDRDLIRNRYGVGLLAFVASYAFFKLALLLPQLRG